jgi:hypothetical protein
MTPRNEKLTSGAVAVVVIAAVLYGAWRWRPANNEDLPDGTFWICQNPDCKNEFGLTVRDFGKFQEKHYGELPPCPKCSKQITVGAYKCQNCKRLIEKAGRGGGLACPYCKKPISSPAT